VTIFSKNTNDASMSNVPLRDISNSRYFNSALDLSNRFTLDHKRYLVNCKIP